MPSPEWHQWQVAAQAAGRGVELTARRKRLFRSRSDAPSTLAAAAQRQEPEQQAWQEGADVDMLRVHSRVALLPPDGGIV